MEESVHLRIGDTTQCKKTKTDSGFIESTSFVFNKKHYVGDSESNLFKPPLDRSGCSWFAGHGPVFDLCLFSPFSVLCPFEFGNHLIEAGKSGKEIIKLFSCSTQLSTKFILLIMSVF